MSEPNQDQPAPETSKPPESQSDGYEVLHPEPPKPAPKPPSLMEGIDEDADFDSDPSLKQAGMTGGKPRSESPRMPRTGPNPLSIEDATEEEIEIPPAEPLIRPGLLSVKNTFTLGGLLALAAAIVSFVTAPESGSGVPHALLTLYECVLHAFTGLIAIVVVALLRGQAAGSYYLAVSRMLVVSSVFFAIASIRLPFGLSFPPAVAGYIVGAMIFFGVRPQIALRIASFHGAIAAFMSIGLWIQDGFFIRAEGEHR